MNTEEVVKMIDAITEGKEYVYENNGGTSRMLVDTDGVSFTSQISFLIENPRTAREIAGALVAWAERKDGIQSRVTDGSEVDPIQNALRTLGTHNRKGDAPWRTVWYTRNVGRMTQQTKDINLRDLVAIMLAGDLTHEEQNDTAEAIRILRESGATESEFRTEGE